MDDSTSSMGRGLKKRMGIPSSMVLVGERPVQMDDLGATPRFSEPPIETCRKGIQCRIISLDIQGVKSCYIYDIIW